jgi:hypothetical protein
MLRLLGIVFLLAAAAAAAHDYSQAQAAGEAFAFSELGGLWFQLHKESLIGLQSGLENRVSLEAYAVVEPVLFLPAAPLLGGIGAALFALGSVLRVRAANKRAARI